MNNPERSRILVVDDDNLILKVFRNVLDEKHYEVVCAVNGDLAFEYVQDASSSPFEVIVSDMLMPGMNGMELLKKMARSYPDCTRVLLTGSDDINKISSAINQASVFRFIPKPIQPSTLSETVQDAVKHHQMVTAEKDVLHTTLVQSVDALVKILELSNGIAFALTQHVRDYSVILGKTLSAPRLWSLEIASLLSQVGYITVPEWVLERYFWGEPLTPKEESMIRNQSEVARTIISRIPRLEMVGEVVAALHKPLQLDAFAKGDVVAVHASIIRFSTDFDLLIRKGKCKEEALEILAEPGKRFPGILLDTFEDLGVIEPEPTIVELDVDKLKNGMYIHEDVKTHKGVLIVSRGYRVNEAIRNRLINFSDEGQIDHQVKVKISR